MAQHLRIVLFLVAGRFIRQRGLHILRCLAAHQGAGYGRARQYILDALYRRQRHAKGRRFRFQQIARRQALHHRDAYAHGFAGFIQLLAVWVDPAPITLLVGFHICQIVDDHALRHQIIDRVDAEHQHVNDSGFHSALRNARVVRAHPDGLDLSFGLELLGIFDDLRFKHALIVLFGINKMDHADIHIIGIQALHKVLKKCLAVLDVARAGILPVEPGRPDMPLQNHLLPAAL